MRLQTLFTSEDRPTTKNNNNLFWKSDMTMKAYYIMFHETEIKATSTCI